MLELRVCIYVIGHDSGSFGIVVFCYAWDFFFVSSRSQHAFVAFREEFLFKFHGFWK